MSSLDPEQHLVNINSKVIASFAKLSEVFWVLLQTQAQRHGLSGTQLQLLLFIKFHPAPHQRKAAFMAREFHVTKATISDSIKALEQKGLIQRSNDVNDSRSFILSLTPKGVELAAAAENFTSPLDAGVDELPALQKELLLTSVFDLIYRLNQATIISTQRMCYNCRYYGGNRKDHHYCNLLNQPLAVADLRLECPEFTQ
ncbi:MAG: MarR family transcriptional regulator [Niastella sp.]|nr:MarR family transcriptional regulator [Niastella sp.]